MPAGYKDVSADWLRDRRAHSDLPETRWSSTLLAFSHDDETAHCSVSVWGDAYDPQVHGNARAISQAIAAELAAALTSHSSADIRRRQSTAPYLGSVNLRITPVDSKAASIGPYAGWQTTLRADEAEPSGPLHGHMLVNLMVAELPPQGISTGANTKQRRWLQASCSSWGWADHTEPALQEAVGVLASLRWREAPADMTIRP